jgi:hypothetical protein
MIQDTFSSAETRNVKKTAANNADLGLDLHLEPPCHEAVTNILLDYEYYSLARDC